MNWFYRDGDQTVGPLNDADFDFHKQMGKIKNSTLVKNDQVDWIAYSEFMTNPGAVDNFHEEKTMFFASSEEDSDVHDAQTVFMPSKGDDVHDAQTIFNPTPNNLHEEQTIFVPSDHSSDLESTPQAESMPSAFKEPSALSNEPVAKPDQQQHEIQLVDDGDSVPTYSSFESTLKNRFSSPDVEKPVAAAMPANETWSPEARRQAQEQSQKSNSGYFEQPAFQEPDDMYDAPETYQQEEEVQYMVSSPSDDAPGLWPRLFAWGIDFVICLVAYWILSFPLGMLMGGLEMDAEALIVMSEAGQEFDSEALASLIRKTAGIGLLLSFLYFSIFLTYLTAMHSIFGATLGKFLFGLRVVERESNELSFGRSLMRTLCYFGVNTGLSIAAGFFTTVGFCFIMLLGPLGSLFSIALMMVPFVWYLYDIHQNDGMEALHDKMAGTMVIKVR